MYSMTAFNKIILEFTHRASESSHTNFYKDSFDITFGEVADINKCTRVDIASPLTSRQVRVTLRALPCVTCCHCIKGVCTF